MYYSNLGCRDVCGLAERHHAVALAAACARFVVEELAILEEPDWAVIDQAPSVAGAMARLAVEKILEEGISTRNLVILVHRKTLRFM